MLHVLLIIVLLPIAIAVIWGAIMLLVGGVAVVHAEDPNKLSPKAAHAQHMMIGIVVVILVIMTIVQNF
jgi:hypothetical protein